MAQKWYAFKNAADQSNEVELFLYNDIGGYGTRAEEFVKELKQYKGRSLSVRINSLGGEIMQGNAIYNALERHQGGVTVHIDGVAASMASVIAMVGKPIRMASNAMLMIHNPWTMAAGEAADLRKQADVLDTMKENIVNAYKKKTGMDESAISSLMDEERWLNAEQAKEMGFVDVIEEGFAMAASAADYRAQFDTFRKTRMENTVITEAAEVSAPAAEPVVEETPVAAEAAEVAAPAVEEPKQDKVPAVEIAVEPVAQAKATDILNKYNAAVARAEAAEAKVGELAAEVASVKAVLDAERSALEALERSLGLAAAKVEPLIKPNAEVRASLLEQFEAISDPAEKARFYAKNRKGILASV